MGSSGSRKITPTCYATLSEYLNSNTEYDYFVLLSYPLRGYAIGNDIVKGYFPENDIILTVQHYTKLMTMYKYMTNMYSYEYIITSINVPINDSHLKLQFLKYLNADFNNAMTQPSKMEFSLIYYSIFTKYLLNALKIDYVLTVTPIILNMLLIAYNNIYAITHTKFSLSLWLIIYTHDRSIINSKYPIILGDINSHIDKDIGVILNSHSYDIETKTYIFRHLNLQTQFYLVDNKIVNTDGITWHKVGILRLNEF